MRSTNDVRRTSAGSSASPDVAAWWQAARPRTLPASMVPVAVGLAVAGRLTTLDVDVAVATLLAAVCLQIAANLANDYADCERGIDTAARLGPTRVTQSGRLTPGAVRRGTRVALGLALLCGLRLVVAGGWAIAGLGLVLMLAAVAYSVGRQPLAWRGLGEVMAFVFFGPVAVCGTVYLQTGRLSLEALGASVPVGCLVAAIMVVNNLRDIPTDRATGKHTLAVRIGPTATRYLYAALVGCALCSLLPLAQRLSPGGLLALLAAPLAAHEVRAVWQRDGALLNHSLAGTARLLVVTGTLLVVGLQW